MYQSYQVHVLSAFMDSGTPSNFISAEMVTQLTLPTRPLEGVITLSAIDKSPIGLGPLLLSTKPLTLQVDILHKVSISFFILASAIHPVVNGLP